MKSCSIFYFPQANIWVWVFRHIHEYFFSSEYFHYKIFINENCLENWNDKFQENLSRPGIIDARARYRTVARRLRNTALNGLTIHFVFLASGVFTYPDDNVCTYLPNHTAPSYEQKFSKGTFCTPTEQNLI